MILVTFDPLFKEKEMHLPIGWFKHLPIGWFILSRIQSWVQEVEIALIQNWTFTSHIKEPELYNSLYVRYLKGRRILTCWNHLRRFTKQLTYMVGLYADAV